LICKDILLRDSGEVIAFIAAEKKDFKKASAATVKNHNEIRQFSITLATQWYNGEINFFYWLYNQRSIKNDTTLASAIFLLIFQWVVKKDEKEKTHGCY